MHCTCWKSLFGKLIHFTCVKYWFCSDLQLRWSKYFIQDLCACVHVCVISFEPWSTFVSVHAEVVVFLCFREHNLWKGICWEERACDIHQTFFFLTYEKTFFQILMIKCWSSNTSHLQQFCDVIFVDFCNHWTAYASIKCVNCIVFFFVLWKYIYRYFIYYYILEIYIL